MIRRIVTKRNNQLHVSTRFVGKGGVMRATNILSPHQRQVDTITVDGDVHHIFEPSGESLFKSFSPFSRYIWAEQDKSIEEYIRNE